MGKSSINGPFSMAMLNNQRVVPVGTMTQVLGSKGKENSTLDRVPKCTHTHGFHWLFRGRSCSSQSGASHFQSHVINFQHPHCGGMEHLLVAADAPQFTT